MEKHQNKIYLSNFCSFKPVIEVKKKIETKHSDTRFNSVPRFAQINFNYLHDNDNSIHNDLRYKNVRKSFLHMHKGLHLSPIMQNEYNRKNSLNRKFANFIYKKNPYTTPARNKLKFLICKQNNESSQHHGLFRFFLNSDSKSKLDDEPENDFSFKRNNKNNES